MTVAVHKLLARDDPAYEEVASEYYDSVRHPTCANFREASQILLSRRIDYLHSSGLVCEVGAGDSLVAGLLQAGKLSLSHLVLLDRHAQMLRYSRRWLEKGAHGVIGDAARLPFRTHSLAAVVTLLGDPYQDPWFWGEVARVLAHNGVFIFTTPSWEWAKDFRSSSHAGIDEAEFVLRTGTRWVPSRILPRLDQERELRDAGLEIVETVAIGADALTGPLSPKLRSARQASVPILTGYVGRAR